MNTCIICGNEFEPPKTFKQKRTCSKECYSIHMHNLVSDRFLSNKYKKGNIPFNKGIQQKEWMSKEGIEKCKNTYIQNQSCKSNLSYIEGRYLPHNTKTKGTITMRKHIHTKGKNKGKIEYEYYINIDWKGNRKPNNLFKRYIWEVNHQQDIPDGYVIYCKDGNSSNLDISNLELISRKELVKRNRWGG